MKLKLVVSLFLCVVAASCSIAYGAGLPGLAGEPTQADFSFTGTDDDAKPAPAPGGDALVERELSGNSMSFSFTGDDSDAGTAGDGTAARPPVSGEDIIQREMSTGSKSFGFTD